MDRIYLLSKMKMTLLQRIRKPGSCLQITAMSSINDSFDVPNDAEKLRLSSDTVMRVLLLDGDDGSVACRIYGKLIAGTLPRLSENGAVEFATRSLLRMNNLIAVRGLEGCSMIGPADYFGNLEKPHRYLYTIDVYEFPPLFRRWKIAAPVPTTSNLVEIQEPPYLKTHPNFATLVKATWISGYEKESIGEKKAEYKVTKQNMRQSLFKNPGLLEMEDEIVILQRFDARDIDLTNFKARLVDNSKPFQITSRKLPPKDEFRLISYVYERSYAAWQVQNGSGLFLERHDFSQTMTPLTPDSGGFVVLARTLDEVEDALELIGVEIPFGYTLIIEEDCIHGDTTLKGFFMMGMTSDHTSMRTADTVFLKCRDSKANVQMIIVDRESNTEHETGGAFDIYRMENAPYVLHKNATEIEQQYFRELTRNQNFIFNPFCKAYWRNKFIKEK